MGHTTDMEMFLRFRERVKLGDVSFSTDVCHGVVDEVETLLSDAAILAAHVNDKKAAPKTTKKKTSARS